jgi:hypothetical protein
MNRIQRQTGNCAAVCLAIAALASCFGPDGPTTVTSGTIGGIAFTVTSGTIYQDEADGPVYADTAGGTIALDATTTALGMTNPYHLRLDTEFQIASGGVIDVRAYGSPGSDFSDSLGFSFERAGSSFSYRYDLTVETDVTGTLSPDPVNPDSTLTFVSEFYGVDAIGYGAGSSGITAWPIGVTTPTFCGDLSPSPSVYQTANLTTLRAGYYLKAARLVSVTPVDDITGPCE